MLMGNLARGIGCIRNDIDIATREEPHAHEGPPQHYHGARTRNLAHTRNLDPDEQREEPHTRGEPLPNTIMGNLALLRTSFPRMQEHLRHIAKFCLLLHSGHWFYADLRRGAEVVHQEQVQVH